MTGRPPAAGGGKRHVVAVRFSDHEVAFVDHARGALTRSEYLRLLVSQARKAAQKQ